MMMDCQDIIEKVFDYIDHEMDAANLAQLKAHLDLCRSCFDRVQFEIVLREHIKIKTHHCCPDKVKIRIQRIINSF